MFRKISIHPVWETIILVIVSLGLALGVNEIRPDSLPVIEDTTAFFSGNDGSLDVQVVTAAQAAEAFNNVGAVFVDARPADEYAEGRLPTALNLPPAATEELFTSKTQLLDESTPIIVYCGGETCAASDMTAARLARAGFRDVSVLEGGIAAWLNNGGKLEAE